MIFEIDFNNPKDESNIREFYQAIGAEWECIDGIYGCYKIDIPTFEDLEALLLKINKMLLGKDYGYAALIDFDNPTLYLDKEK